ncbi:mitochondrial escape protein 2, partial [Massospora cicadina]
MFRAKEGGVVLEFEYVEPTSHAKFTQVVESLATEVERHFLRVYPIRGEPFWEDLTFSLPSRVLKVDFIGPTVWEEDLYKEFRPFGRISKITLHNPVTSGFPKYALIHYFNGSSASAARVCLNGQQGRATRYSISYNRRDANFWKWASSHPRLMLPIILGSLLGLLYAIFDPVRVFCIASTISGRFDLAKLEALKMVQILALKVLPRGDKGGAPDAVNALFGAEFEGKIHTLTQLLTGLPESFVFLLGPKGSGREAALAKSLEGRRNVLHIACDKVSQDSMSISFPAMAKEVGYFPIFDLVNKGVELGDKFLVSMTGRPSDLSPSSQAQFQNLFECMQVALAGFSVESSDEPLPVLVFHEFLLKDSADCQWNQVVHWAADMVERKLAHVVFSSESAVTARILDKSLPYRPLTLVEFEDIGLGEAINYVQARINRPLPTDLRQAIQGFGGRISDLNLFTLKIIKGEPPAEAFKDIVTSVEGELRKKLFSRPWDKNAPWVTLAWTLVEALSTKTEVGYDEIRYSPTHLGSDRELSDLEAAGIISIELHPDRLKVIHPGRPIFRVAFQRLAKDDHLAAAILRFRCELRCKDRQQKISALQDELAKLSTIRVELLGRPHSFYMATPGSVKARIGYLLERLKALQEELLLAETK